MEADKQGKQEEGILVATYMYVHVYVLPMKHSYSSTQQAITPVHPWQGPCTHTHLDKPSMNVSFCKTWVCSESTKKVHIRCEPSNLHIRVTSSLAVNFRQPLHMQMHCHPRPPNLVAVKGISQLLQCCCPVF